MLDENGGLWGFGYDMYLRLGPLAHKYYIKDTTIITTSGEEKTKVNGVIPIPFQPYKGRMGNLIPVNGERPKKVIAGNKITFVLT